MEVISWSRSYFHSFENLRMFCKLKISFFFHRWLGINYYNTLTTPGLSDLDLGLCLMSGRRVLQGVGGRGGKCGLMRRGIKGIVDNLVMWLV